MTFFRLVIVAFVVFLQGPLFAQVTEENIKKGEQYLRGMDDARLRINSGVCRISGKTTTITTDRPKPKPKVPVKEADRAKARARVGKTVFAKKMTFQEDIFIAFDFDQGFYRFDYRDQSRSLLTPEHYYELSDPEAQRPTIIRQLSQDRRETSKAKPFDIRALGFIGLTGDYWKLDYSSFIRPTLFEGKLVGYEDLPNGLTHLTYDWTRKHPQAVTIKRDYWISKEKGFSLIRAKYNSGDVIEISWKEINSTWVPVSFQLSNSEQNNFAEWKIDWQLVNEPVPQQYFDPSKLSEKPVQLYSEEIAGELKRVGMLGGGEVKALTDSPVVAQNTNCSCRCTSTPPAIRVTLIVAGFMLIAIAISWRFWKWRKDKNR
jgi:hypothetical protein